MARPKKDPIGSTFDPKEFEDVELPTRLPDEGEVIVIPDESDANNFAKILSVKKQLEKQLLTDVTTQAFAAQSGTDKYGFENIVGVGISEKITGGHYIAQECITVYVVSKEPIEQITPEALVPKEINGIPTDVVATGEISAFPHRGNYRPAPSGVSIGHYKITAGTLGCLVRRGNQLFILSNNHILANSNNASIGDPILQPGPFDGGKVPENIIGQLSQFIPIQFGNVMNQFDGAIAQVSPSLVIPQSKCFGQISSNPIACSRFMIVKKCGRSTQTTRGIITDCNATIRVGYGTAGMAIFQNQIIIQGVPFIYPFSAPGDSGSLVISQFGNQPVGLLFAGSSFYTIASPIQPILSSFGVSVVS